MTCLMIDIKGLELIDTDIKRINHPLVGGIILFTRKISAYTNTISNANIKFHSLMIHL